MKVWLEAKTFLKYSAVGIVNTLLTLLVTFILKALGIPFFYFTSIAYLFGLFSSYILNSVFTFKAADTQKPNFKQGLLFFGLGIGLILLTQGISYVFLKVYLIDEIITIFVTMAIYVILFYVLSRKLIFKKRKSDET